MCLLPSNEKYVIFLHNRYFKNSIFQSIYNKIKENLENKGICVFNIKPAMIELKKNQLDEDKKYKLSFDDTPFPNSNMLYIHLFNGQYYNDSIYIKKRIEIEREMLILLSGKLGVKNINYDSQISEITISKVNISANIKGFKNGVNYNKKIEKTNGVEGREEYLNRGAPAYLKSGNIKEVEEEIKDKLGKMKSNVFNYEFYKNNPKLESFVYKRFEFKMLKLEYTIDTEDISDISFLVKSSFIDYGINISFENNINYIEHIKYTLEFFTDKELKMEYFNARRSEADPFFVIREQYECLTDKDSAVHYISEYVTKLVKNCYYKVLGGCGRQYDFSSKLTEFIKNSNDGAFEAICHHFRSSLQIKNWIYKNLSEPTFEILSDEDNILVNRQNFNKNKTIKKRESNAEFHNFAVSPYSKQLERPVNSREEIHNFATPYSRQIERPTNSREEIHNFATPYSKRIEPEIPEVAEVAEVGQISSPNQNTSENKPKLNKFVSSLSLMQDVSSQNSANEQENVLPLNKINSYTNNDDNAINGHIELTDLTELSKSENSLDKSEHELIMGLESEKNTIISFLTNTNRQIINLNELIEQRKILIDNETTELAYLNCELNKSNALLQNFEKDKLDYDNRHKKQKNIKESKHESKLDKINANITLENFKIKEINATIQKKELLIRNINEQLLQLMEEYDIHILTKHKYQANLADIESNLAHYIQTSSNTPIANSPKNKTKEETFV
jgi:hypothetical protein